MKSNTSRCSSSRKYSATVKPVKATRKSSAGRFRHLPIDQRATRFFRIARNHDARLLHFEPQVVPFARALAHTRENRNAAMLHGDVVNQFLNQHRFANTRSSEQPDFPALQIRLDQVHHFNSGLEHLESRRLIFETGGLADESDSASRISLARDCPPARQAHSARVPRLRVLPAR